MRMTRVIISILLAAPAAIAQQSSQPVALTIYNQDFAVARTSIDLDLHSGVNEVSTSGVTSRLEPDSVILRDPTGKRVVRIAEQNYDAAIVSQEWLLEKYEGKTIDFEVSTPQGNQIVQGRIIRAGFQRQPEYTFDGQQLSGYNAQPLIEVNGKMQFQLPGVPRFPAATDGLLLKPTLRWQIQSDKTDRFTAELAYITGGLNWSATYNVVVPSSSDVTGDESAEVHGWVTINNQSGTDFPQARIKLMAGDVAKLRPENRAYAAQMMMVSAADAVGGPIQVTQKPFDDFHLYDLNRTVALRDGETKQVQFLDAADVTVRRTYLYDGASAKWQQQAYYGGNVNEQRGYGLDGGNTHVYIVEQFKNNDSNHLGMPLPAGRVRLYRRDADGQMEFVGESLINHTPAEETVKVLTGSAFDVNGSRRQTDFHINRQDSLLDETFEIKVTNQKQQPVNVTVVEHLYRGDNWEIRDKSTDYIKRDSRTIEFPLQVPSKGETTLTYSVRYTW